MYAEKCSKFDIFSASPPFFFKGQHDQMNVPGQYFDSTSRNLQCVVLRRDTHIYCLASRIATSSAQNPCISVCLSDAYGSKLMFVCQIPSVSAACTPCHIHPTTFDIPGRCYFTPRSRSLSLPSYLRGSSFFYPELHKQALIGGCC